MIYLITQAWKSNSGYYHNYETTINDDIIECIEFTLLYIPQIMRVSVFILKSGWEMDFSLHAEVHFLYPYNYIQN